MLRNRIDKPIVDVVFEIQHAVYYSFSDTNGTWTKGEIEGPLILAKRNQEPHYCIIILNKQRNNSYYQQVTSETLFEKKHPQLICIRDKNKNVHGIWSSTSEPIDQLFKRLQDIQQINSQSKMLKNLLDIGVDSAIIGSSPESIADLRPSEYKVQLSEEVLRPEFFERGVVFEDREETSSNRGKMKEIIVALASSEQFLSIIAEALIAKNMN